MPPTPLSPTLSPRSGEREDRAPKVPILAIVVVAAIRLTGLVAVI